MGPLLCVANNFLFVSKILGAQPSSLWLRASAPAFEISNFKFEMHFWLRPWPRWVLCTSAVRFANFESVLKLASVKSSVKCGSVTGAQRILARDASTVILVISDWLLMTVY